MSSDQVINKKRKRTKKGILGYSKSTKKILFFVRDLHSSGSDSDESQDPDFSLDETTSATNNQIQHSVVIKKRRVNDDENPVTRDSDSNWSNRVPYEILFKIFEYCARQADGDIRELSSIRSVCRFWSEVGNDPRLWAKLTVNKLFSLHYVQNPSKQIKPSINAKHLSRFKIKFKKFINDKNNAKKFKQVRSLDLSNLVYFDCDNLDEILGKCDSRLVFELNLSHLPKLSSKQPVFEEIIIKHCPNLTRLYLDGLDRQLNSKDFIVLLEAIGRQIKTLSLSRNHLSAKITNSIADYCPSLEELDLSQSTLGLFDLDNLTDKSTRLTRLYLHCASFKTKYTSLESVLASPVTLRSLETVSISDHMSGYGKALMLLHITKLCKDAENLKTIHLIEYKSSNDSYANYFSLIKSNRVSNLQLPNAYLSKSDSCFLAEAIVSKWATSLVELNLSSSSISLQGLELMIDGLVRHAAQCPLSRVNFSGTCVSTDLVEKLVRNLPHLTSVNLNSCRSIERGLKRMLDENDFKKMRKLEI